MSQLAFQEISSSSSSSLQIEKSNTFTVFIIHGLLGSGDDLKDFSISLSSSLSNSVNWRLVLVDLRNNGGSVDRQGLTEPHDMVNAAADLVSLVKFHDWAWPDVVIGHSLGGKVALQYTMSCARGDYGNSARVPKQIWILDSNPGKIENKNHYEEVEKALKTLKTLPSQIPSQAWLVDYMTSHGFSEFLLEWISNSLKKSGEHEMFSFNVDGALQMFESIRDADYWELLEHLPVGTEIVIVRTESRMTWDPDVVRRLESLAARETTESGGKVSVHVVPRSGHWIYRDEPQRLLEIMTSKMVSLVQSET